MMLLKKMYIMLRIKNTEDKILNITNSATNTTLNGVINEIPSITNLVRTT